MAESNEIQALYQQLLDAWNDRSARGMAELITEGGAYKDDGSQAIGRDEIFSHLNPIFEDHPTAQFVSKVKNVRFLGSKIAILRAIASMDKHISIQKPTHITLWLS